MRCQRVGDKPMVWFDDDQWQCDQTTTCRTCGATNLARLAPEGATWAEAMAATAEALPVGGDA